jgi:hypothetical protein
LNLYALFGYHTERDLLLRMGCVSLSLEISFLFILLACYDQLVAQRVGRPKLSDKGQVDEFSDTDDMEYCQRIHTTPLYLPLQENVYQASRQR